MFSVVVPLYNKSALAVECLRSVMDQGALVDEVIVIDDGSTDDSAALVQRHFGVRIQLVRQPNAGVAAARNRGLELARNEFVCLLDADDTWAPGFADEMRRLAEAYPACVFFGCAFRTDDATLGTIDPPTGLPADFFGAVSFLEAFARSSGIICSSSVCVRRSVVRRAGGFPEGKISGEDIETWFRLAREGPFAFSGKRLARIRRNEGDERFLTRMQVVPSHVEWLAAQLSVRRPPADAKLLRRLLRRFALINGVLAAKQGNRALLAALRTCVRPADWLSAAALLVLRVTPRVVAARARAVGAGRAKQ